MVKGIAAGFALAAPGEAIGFLEVKETERNIRAGIVTGLAAASADLLYGTMAIILFLLCKPLLINHQTILTIISGLFLCGFGAKRFFDTPSLEKVKSISGSLISIFIGTFFLTITNSSTIFEFIALFIGFDIEFAAYQELFIFTIGVFCGSLSWWILLSITDKLLKKRISLSILHYLNYISGIAIFSFGLYTLQAIMVQQTQHLFLYSLK